jgi:EAL and modified HD-GYP domain-containing signal transduction protein
MFNWLKKTLTSTTDASPGGALTPLAQASTRAKPPQAASHQKEVEKPLQAPRKILDALNEDSGAGLLARQAIMNRENRLIGYEFSLRNLSSPGGADELLLSTIQGIGVDKLAKCRQLWLRIADNFITSALVENLPPAETVLLLYSPEPCHTLDQALIARAGELKNAGYKLALANWQDAPLHRAWLSLVDYVAIDTTTHNPLEIEELAKKIAGEAPAVQLMACQLESIEEFDFCRQNHYHLFQGNFLTKRENWGRRPKLSTDRTRLCDLLNRLRAGGEIAEIAKQLRYSPTLSYRLLRYINSPAMGLQSRMASIESGLVFLGREKLYRWFTLLLFNTDDPKSTDGALLEQALVRGRMMEILAAEKFSRQQCEEIFVVGMFSLLDILMKLPISVALDPLQLPSTVSAALIDDTGNYAAYLRLAVACEANDFDAMERTASLLEFSVDRVNAAHFEALAWTQDALTPGTSEASEP